MMSPFNSCSLLLCWDWKQPCTPTPVQSLHIWSVCLVQSFSNRTQQPMNGRFVPSPCSQLCALSSSHQQLNGIDFGHSGQCQLTVNAASLMNNKQWLKHEHRNQSFCSTRVLDNKGNLLLFYIWVVVLAWGHEPMVEVVGLQRHLASWNSLVLSGFFLLSLFQVFV